MPMSDKATAALKIRERIPPSRIGVTRQDGWAALFRGYFVRLKECFVQRAVMWVQFPISHLTSRPQRRVAHLRGIPVCSGYALVQSRVGKTTSNDVNRLLAICVRARFWHERSILSVRQRSHSRQPVTLDRPIGNLIDNYGSF